MGLYVSLEYSVKRRGLIKHTLRAYKRIRPEISRAGHGVNKWQLCFIISRSSGGHQGVFTGNILHSAQSGPWRVNQQVRSTALQDQNLIALYVPTDEAKYLNTQKKKEIGQFNGYYFFCSCTYFLV